MNQSYKTYEALRDSKGVSDYEVAKQTGLSRMFFHHWRRKGHTPKVESLRLVANYFGVPITVLIGEK